MKYKIRYTTVLLAGIFCMIPIVCILMFHHLNLTETLSRMGSGGFGASNALLKASGSISAENLIQKVNTIPASVALYIDEEQENGTIRHIYFNDGYVYLPMKSGRFFKASDFTKATALAVVGKEREKDCFLNHRGQLCISVDNTEYQVIGVIGYEQATVLDDYIYLNLNCIETLESPLIFVDCLDGSPCKQISEQLMNGLRENSVDSEQLSGETSFGESVMPKIVAARWFLGILLCCLICLLLVSVQWIQSQRQEVLVRMLVGATALHIAWLISKKYFGIALLSLFVGGLYCFAAFPAYITNLLYGYAVCVVIIVFFLALSLRQFLRLNIQEGLK